VCESEDLDFDDCMRSTMRFFCRFFPKEIRVEERLRFLRLMELLCALASCMVVVCC